MSPSKPKESESGDGDWIRSKQGTKDRKTPGKTSDKPGHSKKSDKSKTATTSRSDAKKDVAISEKEAKARSNPIRISLSTKNPERSQSPRSASSELKGRLSSSSNVGTMRSKDEESNVSGSRRKTPYPSFSKAHSKEAVGSVENLAKTRNSAFTPPLTETSLKPDASREDVSGQKRPKRWTGTTAATPPSPPLTATDQHPRAATPSRISTPKQDRDCLPHVRSRASSRQDNDDPLRHNLPAGVDPPPKASRTSLGRSSPLSKRADSPLQSKPSRLEKLAQAANLRRALTSDRKVSSVVDDTTPTASRVLDSNPMVAASRSDKELPLLGGDDQSPADANSPVTPVYHQATAQDEFVDAVEKLDLEDPSNQIPPPPPISVPPPPPASFPPPPPPPPQPQIPVVIPRVDYLLKNGGLAWPVPRGMSIPTAAEIPLPQLQQLRGGSANQFPARAYTTGIPDVNALFTPYSDLLDAYATVLHKDGSLAVATGHRSVARRLLDRLENVFARDISQEVCDCIICRENFHDADEVQDDGLGWGEILEWVSGRRVLPPWPSFDVSTQASTETLAPGLGIDANGRIMTPAQKLDLSDLPEEWHDHYRRQTQKTKASVDKWLAAQPEEQTSAPHDVDDDTLNFAILTYLAPEDRHTYSALLGKVEDVSTPIPRSPNASVVSFAPSTQAKERPEFIIQRGFALQRLYHMAQPPRDPEVAVFLLKHHDLHNVLTTLSIINANEWEILISGRFDGFLWNGAEPDFANIYSSPSTPQNSAYPSRNTSRAALSSVRGGTPFTRNGTPGPFAAHGAGAPVSIDEDAEIQILNELERDIFDAMNSIEDAFERLHEQAEGVRRALIDRSSGLMSAAATRRSGTPYSLGIGGATPDLGGTPAMGNGQWTPGLTGGDDDPWETMSMISELRPDDSASCFTGRKRRRRRHGEEGGSSSGKSKRHHHHRTPVHGIEEVDEEADHAPERHSSRRHRS